VKERGHSAPFLFGLARPAGGAVDITKIVLSGPAVPAIFRATLGACPGRVIVTPGHFFFVEISAFVVHLIIPFRHGAILYVIILSTRPDTNNSLTLHFVLYLISYGGMVVSVGGGCGSYLLDDAR
jgi:hypothetical protein